MLNTQGIGPATYPVARTFKCRKNSGKEIEVYTVVKSAPASQWELRRAWATNRKGRFVKEFPIANGLPLP